MKKDEKDRVYKIDEPKMNRLKVLQISQTNQLIQHCRYCDTIWQAYQEPEWRTHGGSLKRYLALLGIINYQD
jgi:hypothetical protein